MKNTVRRHVALVRTAMYLTWGIVLVLTAVLVVTFAGIAFGEGTTPGGDERTLQGDVIAVDSGMSISTVTLESDQLGSYPNNDLNIFLNQASKVNVCGKEMSADDINVGRNAIVTYHERGGVAVADGITERC